MIGFSAILIKEKAPKISNPALLNAETDVNAEAQTASNGEYSETFKKIGKPSKNPKISTVATIAMTLLTNFETPATVLLLTA